ncbi:rhodopsin channel [Pseudoscourfieldia marina]
MAKLDEVLESTLAIIDVIGFVCLLVFYIYNYVKKTCKWEVIWICSVGMLFNILAYTLGNTEPFVVYPAGAEHKKVPWIRFCGWLFTCPVLLILISNLTGEETYDTLRMIRLVGAFNAMILTGATSAMSRDDSWAYVFYLLSWLCCMAVFVMVGKLFREAIKMFPEQARTHVQYMAICFYIGWTAFGIAFALGKEGWAVLPGKWSEVFVYISDIITKHIFGYIGWSLRWKVLRPLSDAGLVQHSKRRGFAKMKRKAEVLVCEPETPIYEFWRSKLSRAGATAVHVRTNKEAEAKINKNPDRFIFLLINLETLRKNNYRVISGADPSPYLRLGVDQSRHVPVVAYLREIDEILSDEMTSHGLDDYLVSPFDDDDVQIVMKQMLLLWLEKHRDKELSDVKINMDMNMNGNDPDSEARRRSTERRKVLNGDSPYGSNQNLEGLAGLAEGFPLPRSGSATPNSHMPNGESSFTNPNNADAAERLEIIRNAIKLVNEQKQSDNMSKAERSDLEETLRELNRSIREVVTTPSKKR